MVTKSTPKSFKVLKPKCQRISSRHSSGFVTFVLLILLIPIYFYFLCWFYKPSNGDFLLISIWVPINPIKGKLASLVKINLPGQSLEWCWINPILWAAGKGHGHDWNKIPFPFAAGEQLDPTPCAGIEKHFWKQEREKPNELQDSWKTHFSLFDPTFNNAEMPVPF